MNIEKDIENVVKKAEANARKIEENSYRINQNTGALEVLHTIKANTILFFIMWMITFAAFVILLCYTIHFVNDTETITTTTNTNEVEQDANNGSNYYVGGDGEING